MKDSDWAKAAVRVLLIRALMSIARQFDAQALAQGGKR